MLRPMTVRLLLAFLFGLLIACSPPDAPNQPGPKTPPKKPDIPQLLLHRDRAF
jgi:hypothetical protein